MVHLLRSATIQLRTLGRIDLRAPEGVEPEEILSRPKEIALVVYLAMNAGDGYTRRDTLLALFWPELDDARGRHALRQMLYSLRRRLGGESVISRGNQEVGIDPAHLECDAARVLAAAAAGELERAVALYGGEFLTGFTPGDVSPELEQWIDRVRGRVRRAAMEAGRTLRERAEESGDGKTALHWSRRAVEIDGFSEADVLAHVKLLAKVESVPVALETYEAYRLRLESEIEIPPGPDIQREVERLRAARTGSGAAVRGVVRPPTPATSNPTPLLALPPGPTVPLWRRWWPGRGWRIAAVAVVAATLAVLGVVGRTAMGTGAAALPSVVRLAIVPLPATDAQQQPEAARLAYAGAWVLGGDANLTVVDPGMVRGLLQRVTDPRRRDLIARVRAELGAHVVLTAQAWPTDGGRVLRMELWDRGASSAPAAATTVDLAALQGDPTALAAAAGDFLRAHLRGTDLPRPLEVPVASTAALDAYVLGDSYLSRGEPRAAIREFERAVAADSGFTLAWHRLSVAAALAFNGALADSAAERAGRGDRKLAPRFELMIEARRAYRKGLPQQAEVALRTLLARDSGNVEGQHQLAEVLLHFNPIRGRSATEALPLFLREGDLGPPAPEALYHSAQLALLTGDTVGFHRASAELLSLSAGTYRAPQIRILQAHVARDPVAWRRELGRLASAEDFVVFSAAHNVAVYGGSPAAAAEVVRLLTNRSRSSGARALGYQALGDLALARGRPAEAWDLYDRARVHQPEATLVHQAFMAALPTVPVDSSRLHALRRQVLGLRSRFPESSAGSWYFPEASLYPELIDYLDALLALKQNRLGEVTRSLRAMAPAADGSRGGARLFALLGQRYRLSTGALSSPQTDLLGSSVMSAEQAVLSPVYSAPDLRYLYALNADQAGHHRLALRLLSTLEENSIPDLALAGHGRVAAAAIHERLGEPEHAAAFYRSAIDLWEDAEPPFEHLVDEAREGLRRVF